MSNINHVTMLKTNGKISYHVYYNNNKKISYTDKDNLPITVVNFITKNTASAETITTPAGTITLFK